MARDVESVIVVSSDEEDPASRSNRVVDNPSASVATRALWGQHQDYGHCRGSNQLPCCFGLNGQAAMAGPNGRCDLCTGEVIEMLHASTQQRLTHLLADLTGKPLEHALIRLKMVLGTEARDMYESRRRRAIHRRTQKGQTRHGESASIDKGSE